nr:MAG TPA: hypothetical protein [Crassvirales sp.]
MTILIISIIAVIVIYYLAIISRTTNTIPTPPTSPKTSTNNKESLIGPCVEEVWSLTEFAKKFDRMKVGDCTNHDTGKVFKSCIFFKDNTLTFVYFYKTLGVLTKEEISKREGELKVGRTSNNKYYLYVGKDNIADDVDLGFKE